MKLLHITVCLLICLCAPTVSARRCEAWLVQSIPTDMPDLRLIPGVLSTSNHYYTPNISFIPVNILYMERNSHEMVNYIYINQVMCFNGWRETHLTSWRSSRNTGNCLHTLRIPVPANMDTPLKKCNGSEQTKVSMSTRHLKPQPTVMSPSGIL